MSAPKMYRVEWEANGHTGIRYLGTDDVKKIEAYYSQFPVKHYIRNMEVVYEVGQIIEFVDTYAEDDSYGTIKKAFICRFDIDQLIIEMASGERWKIHGSCGYKVIGSVSLNADGYIADIKEARKAIESAWEIAA